MKGRKAVILALAAMFAATTETGAAPIVKIGLAMPTKSLRRWNLDGSNMEKLRREKGYEVDLQFAENKVETLVPQTENMVTKGAKVIVVGSIDGGAMEVLQPCIDQGRLVVRSGQPTRGNDVGAKYEIYCVFNELARRENP